MSKVYIAGFDIKEGDAVSINSINGKIYPVSDPDGRVKRDLSKWFEAEMEKRNESK